jgi:hypothetical protein
MACRYSNGLDESAILYESIHPRAQYSLPVASVSGM